MKEDVVRSKPDITVSGEFFRHIDTGLLRFAAVVFTLLSPISVATTIHYAVTSHPLMISVLLALIFSSGFMVAMMLVTVRTTLKRRRIR